jgi:hypothetical protein
MPALARRRFWIEGGLACACGLLASVTLVWREWIEALTGLDPDHGNGSVEWTMVAVLWIAALLIGGAARREWRRSRAGVLALD